MSRAPVHFKESLEQRAFPYRYRKVGSPSAFLDDIGLLPLLEYIYKGNTLIDAAEEMDIPVTYLLAWIESNGYQPQIEEAYALGAQGYLSRAARDLKRAKGDMEFKKAKELLAHARFMASKHDRGKYGEVSAASHAPAAGVQYVFNIGDNANPQTLNVVAGALAGNPALPHDAPQAALPHAPQDDAAGGAFSAFAEPVTLDVGALVGGPDDALTLGVEEA